MHIDEHSLCIHLLLPNELPHCLCPVIGQHLINIVPLYTDDQHLIIGKVGLNEEPKYILCK